MIQYSLFGRTAASTRLNTTFRGLAPSPSSGKTANQFCLRMGTELVPKTLYLNELTRLCARKDYIEFCAFLGFSHQMCFIYVYIFFTASATY
jgi:hypothetical protein